MDAASFHPAKRKRQSEPHQASSQCAPPDLFILRELINDQGEGRGVERCNHKMEDAEKDSRLHYIGLYSILFANVTHRTIEVDQERRVGLVYTEATEQGAKGCELIDSLRLEKSLSQWFAGVQDDATLPVMNHGLQHRGRKVCCDKG